MFLVELHAIPDLTFEGWGLLVQALAVCPRPRALSAIARLSQTPGWVW